MTGECFHLSLPGQPECFPHGNGLLLSFQNFGKINIWSVGQKRISLKKANIYLTKILKGQQKSIALRKTLRLPRK